MKNLRKQQPLLFALAAALIAALCFWVVPESAAWVLAGAGVAPELLYSLLQAALAAGVMAVLYVLSGGLCLGEAGAPELAGRLPGKRAFPARNATFVVLAAALLLGAAKVGVQGSGLSASASAVAALVIMLTATGIFEEVLFRGLMFEGFARTFASMGTKNSAVLAAAVTSSLLFGILHVTSDLGSLFRVTAYLEAAAKIAEGALFGLVMCALYLHARSVWPCALLHAAFDIVSETPIFVATGVQTSTYITGSPADLALVAAAAVVLALPAKWAYDYLKAR